MSIFTQHLCLDVGTGNPFRYVYAKQNDSASRFINITLLAFGEKIIPESGAEAKIRAQKPDGTAVFNPALINSDGTVTVELTDQMLALKGDVKADIMLIGESGEILSSVLFYIRVEEVPAGQQITSQNEFLELVESKRAFEEDALEVSEAKAAVLNARTTSSIAAAAAQLAATNAQSAATSAQSAADSAQSAKTGAESAAATAQSIAQNFENLSLEATKANGITTVEITRQDGSTDTVEIADGTDGCSVTGAYINSENHLIITLSDSSNIDAGELYGINDHSILVNRDAENQHPMSAISGLIAALNAKQPSGNYALRSELPSLDGIADENYVDSAVGGEADVRQSEDDALQEQIDELFASAGYTKSETDALLDEKQDIISDIGTVRSGALLGATAYQKPSGGIPSGDIAPGVIPSVPGNVSAFTNDSGYLTLATLPVYDGGVS